MTSVLLSVLWSDTELEHTSQEQAHDITSHCYYLTVILSIYINDQMDYDIFM